MSYGHGNRKQPSRKRKRKRLGNSEIMYKCDSCGSTNPFESKYPCAKCKDAKLIANEANQIRWVITYDVIKEQHDTETKFRKACPAAESNQINDCNCNFISGKVDIVTAISKRKALEQIVEREKAKYPNHGFYFKGGIEASKYKDGMNLLMPEFMEL